MISQKVGTTQLLCVGVLLTLTSIKGSILPLQGPNISKHPVLLVVSFDGFRWDYGTKTETPNLDALRDEGVNVPYLQAQFPTKTFPNHQSVATGLLPDVTGITDNILWDPLLQRTLNGRTDPEFWNYHPDVLPFWIRNEQAGEERWSGAFMWAGSNHGYGVNQNLRPTHYIPTYDTSVPWDTRVQTVIGWMTHESKPANIVFLYHHEPDSVGHSLGPDDPATLAEVRRTDDRVGVLVDALKSANIYDRINLIILSDHGMAAVPRANIINTAGMVTPSLYFNNGATPLYQIIPRNPGDLQTIYDGFLAGANSVGNSFSVYKKEELLPIFRYGSNRRIMDILLLAEPGFGFQDMGIGPSGVGGMHGYSNAVPDMRGTFVAVGPNFKKAYTSLQPLNNLDLVPLFSRLMGVSEPPNNGSLDRIVHILEEERMTILN